MPHVIIKTNVDDIREEWEDKKAKRSLARRLRQLARDLDDEQKAISVKSLARKYGYPINTVRYILYEQQT